MCDTFVALGDATAGGEVVFGKNSDRPQGEIQIVVSLPTAKPVEDKLQCTYIGIPQVEHTFAVILSKPDWMWGAEMGANERGVVIGNEAVWTTQPYSENGLLGMDLLRLGLERGESALHALEVIVGMMDEFGQGGNCAENSEMNYHNSYIIADQKEAWVLETAGKYWVADKVTNGTRSISNNLSIRGKGDLRHPEVIQYMVDEGKISNEEDFNFLELFSPGEETGSISPLSREARVQHLCKVNTGQFDEESAKSILRDHEGDICWHGEFETRGSQISKLGTECTHWFIEEPFPCQQEYKMFDFQEA